MIKVINLLLFSFLLCGCSGGGSSFGNSATTTSQDVPLELSGTRSGQNTALLSWQPPPSAAGRLTKYNIYRDGSLFVSLSSAASTVVYSDINLSAGRSYAYAVSALMTNGTESALSLTVMVSIPLPPPTNLTAIETTLFSFKFSWTAPEGSSGALKAYKIYRDGVLVSINSVTDTSYGDSSLIPATSYSYTVVASTSLMGDTDPSTPIVATTLLPGNTMASPVKGVVLDPATGSALSGVVVSSYNQSTGSLVSQVTTDVNGQFTFSGLILGMTYYLQFSIAGYDTAFKYYNIIPYTDNSIPAASPLFLQPVRLVQSTLATQTSALTGFVKNATNNSGLSNMTVNIRKGISNQSGEVLATATTSAAGMFTFPVLPLGTYTAEVSGSISGTAIVKTYATLLNYVDYRNADIAVSLPIFSASGSPQYRVILSWASEPRDLDSHMTGPTTAGVRFHVYYPSANRTWPLSSTGILREVFLDVDNTVHGTLITSDNGPETTTILIPRVGTYNFYVHHFSGTGNITSSAASVNLYKGNQLLKTYYAPLGATGVDDVWSVFSMNIIDTTTETISTIGTISVVPSTTLP